MVSVLFRAVDVLFRPAVLVLTVSSILGLCLTMELAEPSPRDKEVRLKVLTLNCWGVPLYGSKDIDERFQLIGRHFSESDYDILMLQEVWRDADYRTLVRYLHSAFPHFHYFYSGFVGSGCCIFSKWQIVDVIMHQYSLNGYVHKLLHCDFLGAKALNGVILDKDGLRVAVFTTHLHAEYDHDNDVYLAHRVAQAYELSELIRWTHKFSDCVILGGDLNLQPSNLGYQLILANAGLNDAWKENGVTEGIMDNQEGSTCDIPSNTYVDPNALLKRPKGQRIDYILYRDGNGERSTTCASCHVFSKKGSIPIDSSSSSSSSKIVSFSDHEGVEAELVVRPRHKAEGSRLKEDDQLKGLLEECLRAMRQGMDKVHADRKFCVTLIIIAILVSLQFFYSDLIEGSQGTFSYLPHLRLFNLNSWIGCLSQKLLLIVVIACAVHAVIISTFEHRALLAHANALHLRLQNM